MTGPRVVFVVRTSEMFRAVRGVLRRFRSACLLALAVVGGIGCAAVTILVSAHR